MDYVLLPRGIDGGHIAGEAEFGKRRESDIVRASDAGFQHPAAPHGNTVALAEIVDAPCHGVAADAAKLDVYDLARAQFDGGACLLFRVNALIQADRRSEPFLPLVASFKNAPAPPLCLRSPV